MNKLFLLGGILFFSAGCAKIPVASVQLSDAVMQEGARMHQINISMVNDLFNEKKKNVNEFIENVYTPQLIQNTVDSLTDEQCSRDSLPLLLNLLMSEIEPRRDALVQALEDQRLKLVGQLNNEYAAYYDASYTIHNLLQSAAKVDAERASLYEQIKKLSGDKIDLDKIEQSVDAFISKAGTSGDYDAAILELDNIVNQIIKK